MSVPDGFVSVEAKEIEVTKTINDHQFDTLAVVMNLQSSREDAVHVTVVEPLPAGSTPDDIWFHSEYGGEHWEVSDDGVTFTRALEPDESFTTVYGTESFDEEEANLLSEPTVTVDVGIELDESRVETESEERDDPLDNLFEDATQATTVPNEEPSPKESREMASSTPPDTQDPDQVPTGTAKEEEDEEVTVPVNGGIGRVLAKELRNDRVATKDRELIREALTPGRGSMDARIEHLRDELAVLEDYTEDLEEFLDDEGGAAAVIESFEDEIASLRTKIEAITGDMGEITNRVDDVGNEVETTRGDIKDIRDAVEQHSTKVGDVDDRVENLRQEIEALDAEFDRVVSVDQRLDGLESNIDSIREELAGLRTFRDRLTAVVGADQGEPASSDDNG